MAISGTARLGIFLFACFIHSTIATDDKSYEESHSFVEDQDAMSAALAAAALESRIERIHGIIGAVTFVGLFPLGAILLRLLPGRLAVWLHAIWQVLALCLALVTLGMGVWLAKGTAYIETYHAILGIFVIASVCIQPITGWLHHMFFKKTGTRGVMSYVHRYWGIGAITLGIINGGFGLQLVGADNTKVIVYAVMASLVWVAWMGISVVSQCFGGFRKRKTRGLDSKAASDGELKRSTDVRESSP